MRVLELISVALLMVIQLRFSSAFQCYSCNSKDDENCATFRANTTAKECSGSCAVWLEGVNTVRGCEDSKPSFVTNFESCDKNGCNKKVFPDGRIKCVSCSADEDFCVSPDADLLYPCKNFEENDSCYTHVIDENSAIRGCLSDKDANVDFCNSVGESCIKCSETFCNVVSGKTRVDCLTCSSETDPTCEYTQSDNEKAEQCEAILGRENLCFAYRNSSHSIRGCLNNFPELKETCMENSEDCQICDEFFCNSMKIVEETCVFCDSTIDEGCKNNPEIYVPTLCGEGSFNKSGCYLSDKDGLTKRGCVTSLNDDNLKDCRDGVTCKICRGNMCNKKESFQKCFSCSSEIDENCATLRGSLTEKVCDDYLDICKVYVKPNETTHRGCFKDDKVGCSPLSGNCKFCEENNCNGEVFPATRLSCVHCEGEKTDSDCYKSLGNNSELSYPCATFNFRDSCYLYIENTSVVHRGCMSDKIYPELCQNDPKKCQVCSTSNCNFESVMKAPELSCINCDTTNGLECNWGFSEAIGKKCEKEIFFYETESCYIIAVSDQTIRGCTLDGNVCRVSSRCKLCTDNTVCNRANTAQQFCYECSSETDKNCGPEPFHTKNVTCPGIIQYEHRGCYTWTSGEGNVVKRGCYSNFTADDRRNCGLDDENCERCVDGNCNDQPKGSAGTLKLNLSLMFLVFLVFCLFEFN